MRDGHGCQHQWGQQSVCCHVQDCIGMASSRLYCSILYHHGGVAGDKGRQAANAQNAARCYDRNKEAVRAATWEFGTLHSGAVNNIAASMKYQVRRLDDACSRGNCAASGRPAKVSQQPPLQTASTLEAGFLSASIPRQWNSRHQAEQLSPQLHPI